MVKRKKIPPPRLLISLLKCLILLQNLMTIFLTIILSYKTLFYLKNWCLLPPPHLVIFHFWLSSTFIPGSTFIREMRVYSCYTCHIWHHTFRRRCHLLTQCFQLTYLCENLHLTWKCSKMSNDVSWGARSKDGPKIGGFISKICIYNHLSKVHSFKICKLLHQRRKK